MSISSRSHSKCGARKAHERCATTPSVIHSDVELLSKEVGSRRPQNRTSDSLIGTIYMEGEGGLGSLEHDREHATRDFDI